MPQDEDCLVLNIWRPVDSVGSTEKLPVLVFIHGGAWKMGSGLEHYINATHYVKVSGAAPFPKVTRVKPKM
jgi:carboxylesterase type B